MRTFALYPEAQHWWSMNDYGAVVDLVEQLRPARVLEFGPGSSTLALLEGGAGHVDACEDDPHWRGVHEGRLLPRFADRVTFHAYTAGTEISVPSLDAAARFDLALIDGPLKTMDRLAVIRFALDRAAAVFVPTEEPNTAFLDALLAIAEERDLDVEIRETGPLAGSFALLRPRAAAPAVAPEAQVSEAPPAAAPPVDAGVAAAAPHGPEGHAEAPLESVEPAAAVSAPVAEAQTPDADAPTGDVLPDGAGPSADGAPRSGRRRGRK